MARFLPVTVAEVARETRDAVRVTLAPRAEDADAFRFRAGQYLTLRRDADGPRRSYSICEGEGGALRVGIKRVAGGAFSAWANEAMAPGDVLEALPPQGRFTMDLAPEAARHHLMVAAGSGITPILSHLRTVLAAEPRARVTLLYGNRTAGSAMFREALEDLKNENLGRLSVVHVLSRGAGEVPLFQGRIDAAKLVALGERLVDLASVDLAWLCGPEAMTRDLVAALRGHGLPEGAIRYELFGAARPAAAPPPPAPDAAGGRAVITLDGLDHEVPVAPGQTVLEAARAAELDVPFACLAGVCSTCVARVTEGAGEMRANDALEDDAVRDGFVLTCQCLPTTDRIAVTYDH